MAYEDLDKIINVNGGTQNIGGADDPYNYPLSDKLIAFNVVPYDNDGETSVQKWIPALDPDYHGVANSLNSNYQVSVVQGTGALSIKSKTYSYDKNINNVNDGRIKYGLYFNQTAYPQNYTTFPEIVGPNAVFQIDETNKKILSADGVSDSIFSDTGKAYIVEPVAGTYYLIVQNGNDIISYSCNNKGVITNTTPVDTYTISNFPTATMTKEGGTDSIITEYTSSYLIGNKNNYIFYSVILFELEGHTGSQARSKVFRSQLTFGGGILTIDNSGNFSLVNENLSIDTIFTDRDVYDDGHVSNENCYNFLGGIGFGSVLYNNTAIVPVNAYGWNQYKIPAVYVNSYLSVFGIFSVDMSNTTNFTASKLYEKEGGQGTNGGGGFYTTYKNKKIICAYDGSNIYFERGNDIRNATADNDSSFDLYGLNSTNTNCLYVKRNTLNALYDSNSNIGIISKLNILGLDVEGGTSYGNINTILNTSLGTNEDDSFVSLKFETTVQVNDITQELLPIELKLNGVSIHTENFEFFPAQTGNRINTDGPTINLENYQTITGITQTGIASPNIVLELSTTNPNSRDIKLGFGLTGGNYNTPTGTNDASGDATSGRDVGSDGMYLEIELEE